MLMSDASILRAWPVDQMEKNSVDPLDSERKQAFMAVIHSDTKKKIGWDVTYDPAGSVPIRWAEKVEPDNWKNQLLVSCKSWWYRECFRALTKFPLYNAPPFAKF